MGAGGEGRVDGFKPTDSLLLRLGFLHGNGVPLDDLLFLRIQPKLHGHGRFFHGRLGLLLLKGQDLEI